MAAGPLSSPTEVKPMDGGCDVGCGASGEGGGGSELGLGLGLEPPAGAPKLIVIVSVAGV